MEPAQKLRLAVNELTRRYDAAASGDPCPETKMRTEMLRRCVAAASERTTLCPAADPAQPLEVAPTAGRYIGNQRSYRADPEWLSRTNPVVIADTYEQAEVRMGLLR